MNAADRQREALRQQMLVRAIWHDARSAVVGGWLRDGPRLARGLQAYQANAGALAGRALAAAFPTVQQLLGDESFDALARAFWHAHPPQRGDVGEWGEALPAFVQADAQLADEPYLADVARVDWAVHAAERAADTPPPQGLMRLAEGDPARLRLRLAAGTALVASPHPVATIWHAHRRSDARRFDAARAALAAGTAETALVQRHGWRAEVRAVAAPEAAFTSAVLAGTPLAAALDAAPGFEFEPWLHAALAAGVLAAVEETAP